MAKIFKFRLERVLEFRRLQEEISRRDGALARRNLKTHNRGVLAILQEQDEGKQALGEMKQESLDVMRLRLQEGYLQVLDRRLRRAVERLQELAVAERDARRYLKEAVQKVRVLERLRGRQEVSHTRAQDRAERNFLDEVAANVFREAS